jgi:hypothetical protein
VFHDAVFLKKGCKAVQRIKKAQGVLVKTLCLPETVQRRPTLPGGFPPSTIGAAGLNDRGRDGNGWIPRAQITGQALSSATPTNTTPSVDQPLTPPGDKARAQPHPTQEAESSRARSLRMGRLHGSRRLHLPPIYLIISQEPSGRVATPGRAHLEVGFPLRCLQRFPRPHVRYPAMLLAEQLVHEWCVHPGPLVLRTDPLNSPLAHDR